ncbi:hypothetical protein [Pseudomonas fluorescens]|uniref:hypothetical protein n=1 Tax=Pseudomonas fluorescens TaxID=294 RepID=UPI000937F6BE|nr:hypothetical protein [Pseudomonas fluorescens]
MTDASLVSPMQNRSSHLQSVPILADTQTAVTHRSDSATHALLPGDYHTEADNELAPIYRAALLEIQGNATRDAGIHVYPIPSASTFGRWWSQLGSAMSSQEMRQWMEAVGVDPSTVVLKPGSGEITYRLRRERDPQRVLHTLGQGDTRWEAVSGPVLAAARIIVADDPVARVHPPLDSGSERAPLETVRLFYKETATPTQAAAQARAAELLRDKTFIQLSADQDRALGQSRSHEVLERHKAALGDINLRYQAGYSLLDLSRCLEEGQYEEVAIGDELVRQKLYAPVEGSYKPANAGTFNRISLMQYLDDHGLNIPTNREQLDNLAKALMTPEPRAQVHGDYSGALGWPQPVDPVIYQDLRAVLAQGKVGDIELGAFKNVLEYLLDKWPVSASEARSPRQLIDNLVDSPKGRTLGAALKAHFDAKSIKGSANDWLLAAISQDKHAEVTVGQANSRLNVEGYRLMSAENAGKTAQAVVNELRLALVTGGKATNLQTASTYTHLLLSSRAPELLVKDIPNEIVLGSHGWVSFVTAARRIAAKSPGATATMTYWQVMKHASIAPVTREEQRHEYLAQTEALRDWAVANGMGFPSTNEAMTVVRTAFNAQINELKAASQTSIATAPRMRDFTYALVKKELPEMTLEQFEKKCITLQPPNRHFPGPYSVADLCMDGRALRSTPPGANSDWGTSALAWMPWSFVPSLNTAANTQKPGSWFSSSPDVDIPKVLNALKSLKSLPDISQPFNAAFSSFAADLEKTTRTQIKHLISTLPLEDRQNLEYGKITVTKQMNLARENNGQPRRSRVTEGRVLVKTERDDQVHTYEIDRLNNTILKRRDLGDFQTGERTSVGSRPYTMFEVITPSGEYTPQLTDERTGTPGIPRSFSSERTAYIADAVIKDIDLPAARQAAKGVTTFDTEVPTYKTASEIALNLIPLRSAIVNFQKGNLDEAANDLMLDIFGFVVGVGAAAKGAKAVASGASALSKAGHVAKIVARTAVGSLNPLDGATDLARSLWAGARRTITAGQNTVNYLRGAMRNVDVLDVIKHPDIAQGTVKTAQGSNEGRVLAMFDEPTNKWYAYDPQQQKMYGKPLEGFTADSSSLVNGRAAGTLDDSLLSRGLASDNVVRMGGPMENLIFIGNEIHTFEDTYKGTKRLNISAHGLAPGQADPYLFNGTRVVVDGVAYDAEGLFNLLKGKGVNPTHYDNVRLLVCHGADGVSTSFAHEFQKIVDRPVKAFEGPVTLNYGASPVTDDRNRLAAKVNQRYPALKPDEAKSMANFLIRQEAATGAPHEVFKNHGQRIVIDTTPVGGSPSSHDVIVNYRPRHFP